MSDSSNDSGDLSLFFSVSSVDSEESEVPEAEGDLETVKPYQFEPVASDSSTESDTEAEDTDAGVEDRLRSRDWTQTLSQLESSPKSPKNYVSSTQPKVQEYCTAGNIGGRLNLAVWRLRKRPSNLNPSNLSAIYVNKRTCNTRPNNM